MRKWRKRCTPGFESSQKLLLYRNTEICGMIQQMHCVARGLRRKMIHKIAQLLLLKPLNVFCLYFLILPRTRNLKMKYWTYTRNISKLQYNNYRINRNGASNNTTFTSQHNSVYSHNENTYIPWVCYEVTHIHRKYAKDTQLVQLKLQRFHMQYSEWFLHNEN